MPSAATEAQRIAGFSCPPAVILILMSVSAVTFIPEAQALIYRAGNTDAAPAADRGQFRFAAVAQDKRLTGGLMPVAEPVGGHAHLRILRQQFV